MEHVFVICNADGEYLAATTNDDKRHYYQRSIRYAMMFAGDKVLTKPGETIRRMSAQEVLAEMYNWRGGK